VHRRVRYLPQILGLLGCLGLVACVAAGEAPTDITSPRPVASTATPAAGSHEPSGPPSPATAPASVSPPATSRPSDPPPASLARTASVEKDGVRVTIELEHNPMPATELTRVKTAVRNLGSDNLTWFHDGCAILISVRGDVTDQPWRPGVEQVGIGGAFKERALQTFGRERLRPPIVDFVPGSLLSTGGFGCADVGMSDTIKPGKSIRSELVWDGYAWLHWGPPPSGPVTLTGTFAYYWRGSHEPESILDQTIELSLDAWITGGVDDAWLSPPEIVDAALADTAFLDYLKPRDLGNGREEILWYRPDLRAWEVGLLFWNVEPEPTMHLVLVDPHSGAVLDTVDRPWSEERDGFP
jgi:hypothetical protein